MNILTNYWVVWPLGIVLWVLLGWVEFTYFEIKGIKHDKPNEISLSMFVYTVISRFPLAGIYGALLIGIFIGTLSTHFAWHWCPPGSASSG